MQVPLVVREEQRVLEVVVKVVASQMMIVMQPLLVWLILVVAVVQAMAKPPMKRVMWAVQE
jgi:hypothetical protein